MSDVSIDLVISPSISTVAVVAGIPGPAGLSAYQVAVSNGFSGTEAQWLASFGATGPAGPAGAVGVLVASTRPAGMVAGQVWIKV